MSCSIPAPVLEYIELVESGKYRACPEQHAFVKLIRKVFTEEDIFVDTEKMNNYLSLQKYWPFDLFPWEKCLIVLWDCTYSAPGRPRWRRLLAMIARGAGKDGVIAYDAMCDISPYNKVDSYDVDICANSEDQAMRPVNDLTEVLDTPKYAQKLKKHYYHTKEMVQGLKNRGVFRGYTSNPKTKDGLRSGKVIFNEIHIYENYERIKVFTSGTGKKKEPRIGFFTSNGDINDGPLDDYLARGRRILFENEPDGGFLPFICCLQSKEQVFDSQNWYMANPSLQYLPSLMQETMDEFEDWKANPAENADFLTKRMGLRAGFKEISVTDYEKVLATNKPLPNLKGRSCTVGIDYAELSDWAAVNYHFREGEKRYDVNHIWVCRQSKTLPLIKAPWQDWSEKRLITVVDEPTINPDLLAEDIADMGKSCRIVKMALDHFRWTLIADAMKKIGWDANDKNKVKLVRPSDIMQIEPVIQACFDRELFHWGDCPPLRWAVNNTKRVRSSKKIGVDTGNFIYAKIEAKSRKTDPFMALVASMTVENELGTGAPIELPKIGAIVL